MKTTIDLPDEILHRAKVYAAQQRTTLRELVLEGLQKVLQAVHHDAGRDKALRRLRQGLHLGGHPLRRDTSHERHPVS